MRILKLPVTILIFFLLTILTQVGGLVYLFSFSTHPLIVKRTGNRYLQKGLKIVSFVVMYCMAVFIIVPLIAKPFGRVALPITQTDHLQPLNLLTCILNRHYVRPELKQVAIEVAKEMNEKYPGTVLNYLDANFPFFNGFPLFPHLSHNDGKKLDLSFCYRDNKTTQQTNQCPSFIGYGICEEPLAGEKNTAGFCTENGYWQYSLMRSIVSQDNKQYFTFDAERTKELVNLFAQKPAIGKIFIEPHLKTRLHLTTGKIRFHGCQAVRHDDHIHVQLN